MQAQQQRPVVDARPQQQQQQQQQVATARAAPQQHQAQQQQRSYNLSTTYLCEPKFPLGADGFFVSLHASKDAKKETLEGWSSGLAQDGKSQVARRFACCRIG